MSGRRSTSVRNLSWTLVFLLSACGTGLYYSTMERFGQDKRDILVSRVQSGQEEQRAAEEQFLTTYELLKQLTSFDGGDLEELYERLSGEFNDSEDRAEDVRSRIRSIEQVAGDLFDEWTHEITLISNPELRRQSQARLRETRARYDELIGAMKRAETRMDPVLTAFRDQVLFLKHNLNARALTSLEGTAADIEADIDRLIRDMRESIRESEVFLASMNG